MALPKLTTNVENVQTLADQVVGQATTTKLTFDKGNKDTKTYINDDLTVAIEEQFATKTELEEAIFNGIVPGTADYFLKTKSDGSGVEWADVPETDLTSLWNEIYRSRKNELKQMLLNSGLNSFSNVFGDSFESATGINASLSSRYIWDSTSKSLKVSPLKGYEASTGLLPENSSPAWTKTSQNSPTISVASSLLNISTTASSIQAANYEIETSNIVAAKEKIIQSEFKFVSGSGLLSYVDLYVYDGTKKVRVTIYYNGTIIYSNASNADVQITTGVTTTTLHTYKITVSSSYGLKLYIDGVQVGSTVAYASLASDAILNRIYVGFTSQSAISSFQISNIFYSIDSSLGTGTATIYWNSQTSEGTLTKAIIEALTTLGTGTATYYISRNNGVTFTQCVLDTITDITSQSSGTSVVLKVVITENVEIQAISYGGQ